MRRAIPGQIVIITGASTGIGRATALHLAERGAIVVLAARADPLLFDLQQQIAQHGGLAIAIPTDVAHHDQVERLVDSVVKRFGRIDALVNNAAQTLYGTVEHTDIDEFRHLMEVNFMGSVHGTKAVLPIMRRQGHGTIIHIGSVEAHLPIPLQGAYAATKAAVVQFALITRQELLGSGIHVCTILPATINTPLFEHARSKEGFEPRSFPPYYDPNEVARAIATCLEHPRRQMVVGTAGRLGLLFQQLAPDLLERFTSRVGRRRQLTDIPEPPRGHDNFDAPMPVPDPLHGSFPSQRSRLLTIPFARLGIAAIATIFLGSLAIRMIRATVVP